MLHLKTNPVLRSGSPLRRERIGEWGPIMPLAATHGVHLMNFLQAIVIGLIPGLTELFPISNLGHTVLVPSWTAGSWTTLVRQEVAGESPDLTFVVGRHLATAAPAQRPCCSP